MGEITSEDREDQFSKRGCKLASSLVELTTNLFCSIKYLTKKLLFQNLISSELGVRRGKSEKMFKKGCIRV
jgi:hypothetical protein